MSELFEKEGVSIFSFKKGDIIVKVNPRVITKTVFNENLGISVEVKEGVDNSFRKPVEFVCVENNTIYLRSLKEDTFWGKKIVFKAHLEEHSEGWALFVVPDGLKMEDCL